MIPQTAGGDPGVSAFPQLPNGEKVEAESTDDDDDPEDNAPFEKTYLAIDGVVADEISDADKERLERTVIEFMLQNGYPIEGARVISDDKNVIEFDRAE